MPNSLVAPNIIPETLASTRERLAQAQEQYTRGAQTPALTEVRRDRVLLTSVTTKPETGPTTSLPPPKARVGSDNVTFHDVHRESSVEACKALPCSFVIMCIQIPLLVLMIFMLTLLLEDDDSSTTYYNDNLRYLPGVMAPAVFLFFLIILQCSLHCVLACLPDLPGLTRAAASPAIQTTMVAPDVQQAGTSCGGATSAIARSVATPHATTQTAIEYIETARSAAVEVCIRVRGGQPVTGQTYGVLPVWTEMYVCI